MLGKTPSLPRYISPNKTSKSNKSRGIIGPILVAEGYAFGTPVSGDSKLSGLTSYYALSEEFTSGEHPSPRYWLLWPGVLCMIAASFTGESLLPNQ